MIKNCKECSESFNAVRNELRCSGCLFCTICCVICDKPIIIPSRLKNKKKVCSSICAGKWSAKVRINPPRSEKARENMSIAQKKRKGWKSWNRLHGVERSQTKKIKAVWGGALYRLLNRREEMKDSLYPVLGYSKKQLMEHLEFQWQTGMSWSNYGKHMGEWNIDHIFPVSRFSLDATPAQVNSLSNLRPMWSIDNSKKGRKIE